MKTRLRDVKRAAAWGGKPCGAETGTVQCNAQACEEDCTLTQWSGWSHCSKDCDGGTKKRQKWVKEEALGEGTCPDEWSLKRLQYKPCNEQVCALDCIHEFTLWTECSKTCGTGHQSRDVVVKQPPAGDGLPCPTSESRLCNTFVCASPHPTAAPTPLATLAPTPSPSPGPIVYPPPILTLTGGDDHLFLEADPTSVYTDAGATCSDTTEGDISEAVIVSGAEIGRASCRERV